MYGKLKRESQASQYNEFIPREKGAALKVGKEVWLPCT